MATVSGKIHQVKDGTTNLFPRTVIEAVYGLDKTIADVKTWVGNNYQAKYAFTISGTAGATYNLATIATQAANGNSAYNSLSNYLTVSSAASTYVTALGTNGNYLTWTKGGTDNNITVPYATTADAANRAFWLNTNDTIAFGKSGLQYFSIYGTEGTSTTENNTPTSAWYHILRMNHGDSDGYFADIAIHLSGSNGIYWRRIAGGTNLGWFRVLDSNNFASIIGTTTYAPYNSSGYLPLAAQGATVYRTTSGQIVNFNNSKGANEEAYLVLQSNGTSKAAVGWSTTFGTYIYNYPSAKYLGIKDDGTPHYHGNTLWHAGNFTPSNYLPLAGGTMANTNVVTNLNADLLDGLDGYRYAHNYSYTLEAQSSVVITFTNMYACVISARWTMGTHPLFLIGSGYGDTGTRNKFYQLSKENAAVGWRYTSGEGIEITNMTTTGNPLFITVTMLSSQGVTVTFTAGTYDATSAFANVPNAFVDSNVASATQLQNTRTIWGQNFNGTANVYGIISDALSIEFTRIASSAGHGGYLDFHYNGSTADYTSRIIESASGTLSLNGQLHVHLNGNVGIGADASSSYKLYVNGGSYINGTTYVKGNIWDLGDFFDLNRNGATGAITTASKYAMEVEATANGILFKTFSPSAGSAQGTALSLASKAVGINTNSPAYTLDVSGTAKVTGNSYFGSDIEVQNGAGINFRGSGGSVLASGLTANLYNGLQWNDQTHTRLVVSDKVYPVASAFNADNMVTDATTFYTSNGDIGSKATSWENFPLAVPSGGFSLLSVKEGAYRKQFYTGYHNWNVYMRMRYYGSQDSTWSNWVQFWNAANSNISTVPWVCSTLTAYSVIQANHAIYANRYNGQGNVAGASIVINKGGDYFGIGPSTTNVANLAFGTTSNYTGTWKTIYGEFGSTGGLTLNYNLAVTGTAAVNGSTQITGKLILPKNGGTSQLSWWDGTYRTWITYMSDVSGKTSPTGAAMTSGELVTTWSLRSLIQNNAGYGWVWESSAESANAASTIMMELSSNTGVLRVKNGIYSNGYVSALGTASSSDAKLKDDITTISYDRAKEVLSELNPREWTWNALTSKEGERGAGMVAQEVESILPDTVKEIGGNLTLEYNPLFAYGLAMTKYLVPAVESLEERVARLERENEELKRQLTN